MESRYGKAKLDAILRVNQAGEYGAKMIYEGQLRALSHEEIEASAFISHMYDQELKHLEYFNNAVSYNRVRPTVMFPIWHVGSYMLGFISGKIGVKAAMVCTAAVEEVIDAHYQEQIHCLSQQGESEELLSKIKKFREEELEHRDIGLAHSGFGPHYQFFKLIIKGLTKAAIGISKRIQLIVG